MNVELHIEQLVLHGFDPRDRRAIGEAVQRELARLFAQPPTGVQPRDRWIAQADGGTFIMPGARPGGTRGDAAGAPIARAVHDVIRPPTRK